MSYQLPQEVINRNPELQPRINAIVEKHRLTVDALNEKHNKERAKLIQDAASLARINRQQEQESICADQTIKYYQEAFGAVDNENKRLEQENDRLRRENFLLDQEAKMTKEQMKQQLKRLHERRKKSKESELAAGWIGSDPKKNDEGDRAASMEDTLKLEVER